MISLPPICWVHRDRSNPELSDAISEAIDYCPTCVEIVAQEYREQFPQFASEISADGGYEPFRRSDSPAYCDRCDKMLSCSVGFGDEVLLIETDEDWGRANESEVKP